MKISITLHDKTYSVETDSKYDHDTILEVAEAFKGLLVAAGYHPENVDEIIETENKWFSRALETLND